MSSAPDVDREKWPASATAYELAEEIGKGGSAVVWRAVCKAVNESEVAIKIVDLEESSVPIDVLRKEIMTLGMSQHPNVVAFYTSFLVDDKLWLVMDFLAGGSVLDIMKFKFQGGLEEPLIATILREALKGIAYFHQTGRIHRDVKAGNILISAAGDVRLADLGVAAWLTQGGERKQNTKTFVGTPCWMAPEVAEQTTGHSYTADIWSFGITALELAHGQAPFAQYSPMKVLVMVLKNPAPTLDEEEMKTRGWSKSFKDLIDTCLQKEPTKRPSSAKLLDHRFFKLAKKPDYVATNMLSGLPPLGARYRARKKELLKEGGDAADDDKKKGARQEIPADDLASDDDASWDFGDDEDAQLATIGAKKANGDAKKQKATRFADGDGNSKSDKPKKTRTKSAGATDADDDDPASKPSRRSTKVKAKESKRKGSRATEDDAAADAAADGKKGRFTMVAEGNGGGGAGAGAGGADKKSDSKAGKSKTDKTRRRSTVVTECINCGAMREQVDKLQERVRELEAELARATK